MLLESVRNIENQTQYTNLIFRILVTLCDNITFKFERTISAIMIFMGTLWIL